MDSESELDVKISILALTSSVCGNTVDTPFVRRVRFRSATPSLLTVNEFGGGDLQIVDRESGSLVQGLFTVLGLEGTGNGSTFCIVPRSPGGLRMPEF